MATEPTKIKYTCTVIHMRNGKVINTVTPYSEASLFGKILYWIGLKNYTREV